MIPIGKVRMNLNKNFLIALLLVGSIVSNEFTKECNLERLVSSSETEFVAAFEKLGKTIEQEIKNIEERVHSIAKNFHQTKQGNMTAFDNLCQHIRPAFKALEKQLKKTELGSLATIMFTLSADEIERQQETAKKILIQILTLPEKIRYQVIDAIDLLIERYDPNHVIAFSMFRPLHDKNFIKFYPGANELKETYLTKFFNKLSEDNTCFDGEYKGINYLWRGKIDEDKIISNV